MHKRKQVRKKIATKLQTVLPQNVSIFTSKIMCLQEQSLPACMIYFDQGSVEQRTLDLSDVETRAMLNIELVDRDSANIDNQLDDLSEVVEAVLIDDYELSGLVEDLSHSSFEFARDEQLPLGSLILSFSIQYEG